MITVVIIDDDPFVTKSLQTILESTKEIRVLGIGQRVFNQTELASDYSFCQIRL